MVSFLQIRLPKPSLIEAFKKRLFCKKEIETLQRVKWICMMLGKRKEGNIRSKENFAPLSLNSPALLRPPDATWSPSPQICEVARSRSVWRPPPLESLFSGWGRIGPAGSNLEPRDLRKSGPGRGKTQEWTSPSGQSLLCSARSRCLDAIYHAKAALRQIVHCTSCILLGTLQTIRPG